jgi:large subunit ribosomal protein L27
MAHTKAGGKVSQKAQRPGRRLSVKLGDGSSVEMGQIISRQRGSEIHASTGVKMGRDFTLYAVKQGIVKFFDLQKRKFVSVISK